jgi:hypothetical protein
MSNDPNEGKVHYRKAFDSPYLSSADLVEPTDLTIAYTRLEPDHTKKTKDLFNTAHFVEKELRPGEKLKPMILNATNSKTVKQLTGSAFIDDWNNVHVTVYVDPNVRFGKESVEGLRISTKRRTRVVLTPSSGAAWDRAKAAYNRDGNLDAVLVHVDMSEAHQKQIKEECLPEAQPVDGE